MAKIVFIQPGGEEQAVDVTPGLSVMEGAVKNGVPGIDADCGGCCACATCHVYVDPAWLGVTGGCNETEEILLELADDVTANSRLSCQITVSDELDGLIVRIPPAG